MDVTRRQACAIALGAAAALATRPATAAQDPAVQEAIDAFAGGKEPQPGMVTLGAPEIAENGNTVPIDVTVDGDAEAVTILAAGNPNPGVATFHFSKLAEPKASTRIRLAETQDVIALARMRDGSVHMDRREIKVTIGGCGG